MQVCLVAHMEVCQHRQTHTVTWGYSHGRVWWLDGMTIPVPLQTTTLLLCIRFLFLLNGLLWRRDKTAYRLIWEVSGYSIFTNEYESMPTQTHTQPVWSEPVCTRGIPWVEPVQWCCLKQWCCLNDTNSGAVWNSSAVCKCWILPHSIAVCISSVGLFHTVILAVSVLLD